MGSHGNEVPMETQFLMIESKDESLPGEMDNPFEDRTVYTVFLPLLEGDSGLPCKEINETNWNFALKAAVVALFLLLFETFIRRMPCSDRAGDPTVKTSEGLLSVYVNAGTNPFEVVEDAVRAVEAHLQTFQHRAEKMMPGILDYFGWCTWDAFYTDVTAEGVLDGLRRFADCPRVREGPSQASGIITRCGMDKSLAEGGTPARFLIIDDGWQSVAAEKPATFTVTEGTQYSSRLTSIKENQKFQKDGKSTGLRHIVNEAKERLYLKYVYVWHALTGYWGGVQPGLETTEQYQPVVTYPVHTPTVLENQPDMEVDSLTVNGVGLVSPDHIFKFYNELHSYLRDVGVDGVKVDAQAILETLGAAFGGRVSVTRQFQRALEASIASNFPDNGCIACMCHNTDTIYSSKQTALVRASDDFWPSDPASHTIHIVSVAYNSIFLGEFMQPDWDMFQSLHPAAEFHAAARAVGGCAVYVSDKPGQHDFNLLKKCVLPDGSVLRARLPGRPTRDCLFTDPSRNGSSLLKIWNMNKYGGVIGAFNCQGAGWCKVDKKYVIHDPSPNTVSGSVKALDVDHLARVTGDDWNGDSALYRYQSGDLVRLPKGAVLPLTLQVLEFEIFTVSPIKSLVPGVCFAPIGLTKMFNSGGAIESLSYEVYDHDIIQMFNSEGGIAPIEALNVETIHGIDYGKDLRAVPVALVKMILHGCGEFGAYSSKVPLSVSVDSELHDFTYDSSTGFVKFILPVPRDGHFWNVAVEV